MEEGSQRMEELPVVEVATGGAGRIRDSKSTEMKTLQFAMKFRRWQTIIFGAFYPVVIACGLAHLGDPWMCVALIGLPAVLIECALKCERNRARCYEQMGRELLHNVPDIPGRQVPSNAAWQLAVRQIQSKGHLHAYVDAKYDEKSDVILLNFQ